MQKLVVLLGFCIVVFLAPSAALARRCPPLQTWKCEWMHGKPHHCRCVPLFIKKETGAGPGSYGHAEVKKKNVPTVKPNK